MWNSLVLRQTPRKERCYFENGAEPYKEDNAKLVQECNELHLKVLRQKEEAERSQKELKFHIRKLESENSDLQFITSRHLAHIKALEHESAEKSRKIVHLQGKNLQTTLTTPGGKKKSFPIRQPTLEIDAALKAGKPWKDCYWSVCAQVKDPYIANMVDIADQRICSLTREVNHLKEDNSQQSEIIATMKSQLLNREREIERLSAMLEGGRPIAAISKDCCYKDLERQVTKSTDEIKRLENLNKELEMKLRESVAHQHEAMTRALQLAERNKQLQNEMHDIDRMALVVEAECSTTVKENTKKVSKIQEKLEASLTQIHDLEREILELKRSNQEQQANLEGCRHEKQNLQKILENTLEEKKKMTNRINNYTVIEHDLMVEIDRLTQTNSLQKRRIAELETRALTADQFDKVTSQIGSRRGSSPSRKNNARGSKNGTGRKDSSSMSARSMSLPTERETRPLRDMDQDRERFEQQVKDISRHTVPSSHFYTIYDRWEHEDNKSHEY